ncbi:MAG: hypothetical protein ABLT11_05225 [Candidatus Acidiferrum sp.]
MSALIIVPCFWHRRIEAGDLPSHTYNAWLAQLIQQGRAPGLYLAPRWNNVLFDFLLLYSAKVFGFGTGPKIAVALCALLFFWGVFSFLAAFSERSPWFLTPCIAMLTYGFIFNMGFFNYYLSIVLACFGLALLWKPEGWDWLAGLLLLALGTLAHPMGSLWFAATLGYVLMRRKFNSPWAFSVPIAAIGAFVAVHWYLVHVAEFDVSWPDRPFYLFNGFDQLVLYSSRYRFVAYFLLPIFILWIAAEFLQRRVRLKLSVPFVLAIELYVVALCATSLLPQDVRLSISAAWIGLLVSRLTVISAIFGLCILSSLQPRKWTLVATLAVAVFFFVLVFANTAQLNRLEAHAESITVALPPGTRVIPTIEAPPDSRIPFIHHVVDRACIAHCFTYSNYEPSSGQFRVRVRPGSPIAVAVARDSQEMEAGNYVVQPTDPPLTNIYQCDPADFTVLCMRILKPGETTGISGPDSEN